MKCRGICQQSQQIVRQLTWKSIPVFNVQEAAVVKKYGHQKLDHAFNFL